VGLILRDDTTVEGHGVRQVALGVVHPAHGQTYTRPGRG
jgi:hypothetical protein